MADKITDYAVNSARWLSLEDFEGEVWKDIPNYNGIYQASNLGRIKSISRPYLIRMRNGRVDTRISKTKILRERTSHNGYSIINLNNLTKYVHVLVASAFLPNLYKKETVDHINTIRSNNQVVNLRWTTMSENMRNPISTEKRKVAIGKPIVMLDVHGNYISEYISASEAARTIGLSRSLIKNSLNYGWCAGGYQFVFKHKYDSNNDYRRCARKPWKKPNIPF